MCECNIDKLYVTIDPRISRESDNSIFCKWKLIFDCIDSTLEWYDIKFIDRLLTIYIDNIMEQIKSEHEELKEMNYEDMEDLFKKTWVEKWTDINMLVKKLRSFENSKYVWNDFLIWKQIERNKLKNVLSFIEIFLQHKILEINQTFSKEKKSEIDNLIDSVDDRKLSTLEMYMKKSILFIEYLKDTYILNS